LSWAAAAFVAHALILIEPVVFRLVFFGG